MGRRSRVGPGLTLANGFELPPFKLPPTVPAQPFLSTIAEELAQHANEAEMQLP